MNKSIIISIVAIALLSSCKSSESAYKKAYEKAKASEETTVVETTTTVVETPVVTPLIETPTTATVVNTATTETANFRTESLDVVDGSSLKSYSVVVGSFSLRDNANGLAKTLRNAGYDARIAYNSDRNMYRVIASSYDSKDSAVSSRNSLRTTYPDAWLLFQK